MLIRVLAPVVVIVLCGATLLQILRPPLPKLIYSPSPSAPIGWYRLEAKRVVSRGDLVAAYAPDEARKLADQRRYLPYTVPLIKTVWAVGGEEICHKTGRVLVAGRPSLVVLTHDSLGRDLPSKEGCYTLSKDEVFLVSTHVQTSFDSRYFGPASVSSVLGPVKYLGRFKKRSERVGETGKAGRG